MRCPSCYKPIADDDRTCPSCGTSLSLWNPPAGNPATRAFAAGEVTYAGFWKRFAAYVVDSLILGIATIIVVVPLALATGFDEAKVKEYEGLINLVSFVAYLLYFALMESSERQATLGKQLLGIRVSRLDGERLTLARAIGRYAAKLLSFITLLIGFIMAGFTARKQALHDLVADTVVVNDPAAGSKTGCMVVILVFALLVPVGLGVFAAIAIPAYQDYLKKAEEVRQQQGDESTGYQDEDAPAADDEASAPDAAAVAAHAGRVVAAVSSHARAHMEMPGSLDEVAGIPADDGSAPLVSYEADPGQLTITSRDGAVALVMTAQVGNDGGVLWSCRSSDMDPKQFPPQCAAW